MAGTISANVSISVQHGDLNDTLNMQATGLTQTTQGKAGGIQNVATSYEALDVGDVATNGWVLLKNLDATNYVEVGREVSSAFYGVVRIEAGEVALFRMSQATMFVQANTATIKLQYSLYED